MMNSLSQDARRKIKKRLAKVLFLISDHPYTGKLDDKATTEGLHPHQEKEPLPAFPDNTNPSTGEIGGPRGPEPTRYGDWERKGRVSDF